MKRIAVLAAGAAVILVSPWAGVLLWGVLPKSIPQYEFAAFLTSMVAGAFVLLVGVGVMAVAIDDKAWDE